MQNYPELKKSLENLFRQARELEQQNPVSEAHKSTNHTSSADHSEVQLVHLRQVQPIEQPEQQICSLAIRPQAFFNPPPDIEIDAASKKVITNLLKSDRQKIKEKLEKEAASCEICYEHLVFEEPDEQLDSNGEVEGSPFLVE